MTKCVKFFGYVWDEGGQVSEPDIDFIRDAVEKAVEKLEYDFDFDTELVDDAFGNKLEKPWPEGKTRYDLDKEFYEMGEIGSEGYGLMWLQVNVAVRDGIFRSGIDAWDSRVRWLAFNIAHGVCEWLQRQEEATIETES